MSYIIIHDTPILFVHIPKTGGRTVLEIFKENYHCEHIPNSRTTFFNYHSTIKDFEKFFCCLKVPYVFTIVRNPWTRAVSWFYFRREVLRNGLRGIRAGKKLNKVIDDYNTLLAEYELMLDHNGFEKWLFKYYDTPWDHTWFKLSTNQTEWLETDSLIISKIIKFENLSNGLQELDFLKGKIKLFPHKNPGPITNKKMYNDLYTTNTKKFIASLYEKDIDKLKYVF